MIAVFACDDGGLTFSRDAAAVAVDDAFPTKTISSGNQTDFSLSFPLQLAS
jgi:hypothetical protein